MRLRVMPKKTLVRPPPLFVRPALLTAAWVLRKGSRAARCTIWSHPAGFELRLVCDDSLPRIKVCRTPEGMVRLQARWRASMEAQGWSKPDWTKPVWTKKGLRARAESRPSGRG